MVKDHFVLVQVLGQQLHCILSGNDYCKLANSADCGISGHFYRSDPLWDGQQYEGQCCSNGKSPPWFTVQLSNPTLDNIAVCIIGKESISKEDTPIELIEMYVS